MNFQMPDANPDYLRETQLNNMRETLSRVYENVPHYRHACRTRAGSAGRSRRHGSTSRGCD